MEGIKAKFFAAMGINFQASIINMSKLCLLVILSLSSCQLAAASEVKAEYGKLICVEPEGVDPKDDPDVEKNCRYPTFSIPWK